MLFAKTDSAQMEVKEKKALKVYNTITQTHIHIPAYTYTHTHTHTHTNTTYRLLT